MKKQEIMKESVHIIAAYYQNDLQPFFDHLAKNVLWIGPRSGQILSGRKAIQTTWKNADHNLRFTMGNIEARSVSAGTRLLFTAINASLKNGI